MKIVLHGALRKLQEQPVEIEAKTPLEALKIYFTQAKQFRRPPGQRPWRVKVVGYTDAALDLPVNDNELHVVPDFNVGKDAMGFIEIVVGAVIIAAAIIISGGTLTPLAYMFIGLGASLALGGLMQLISPAPTATKIGVDSNATGDPAASKYLGSPKNTVAIGTRISILVGRYKGAGQYLSFDIEAVDVAT
jgi:predicted phage tail protein